MDKVFLVKASAHEYFEEGGLIFNDVVSAFSSKKKAINFIKKETAEAKKLCEKLVCSTDKFDNILIQWFPPKFLTIKNDLYEYSFHPYTSFKTLSQDKYVLEFTNFNIILEIEEIEVR